MSERSGGMNAQERTRKRIPWEDPTDHWREEYEQGKLADGFTLVGGTEVAWKGGTRVIGGKWFKPEPEEGPDYCRECIGWDSEEGIWKTTCFHKPPDYLLRCCFGHDHHDGEIWLA